MTEFCNNCSFKDSATHCPATQGLECYREHNINCKDLDKFTPASEVILNPCVQDLENFRRLKHIRDDIDNFVNDGYSLLIHSNNVGNGKTTWAKKLLNQYECNRHDAAYKDYLTKLTPEYNFRPALFEYNRRYTIAITLNSYLLKVRDSYNDEQLRQRISVFNSGLKACKLLLIDDVGVPRLSVNDASLLSDIVETRINNNLSTIYTSNASPDELIDIIGARLTSRIAHNSVCIGFVDGDHRHSTNKY